MMDMAKTNHANISLVNPRLTKGALSKIEFLYNKEYKGTG